MGFSDKMRESLGAEGARIEVAPRAESAAPGDPAQLDITIVGGSRPATVDAVVVRLIEADRHWVAADGTTFAEDEAAALDDRRHLTAGWTRRTVAERRVDVGVQVEPGGRHRIEVEIEVPSQAGPTTDSRSHTLNVQADIKGQIDPTGNARLRIAVPI